MTGDVALPIKETTLFHGNCRFPGKLEVSVAHVVEEGSDRLRVEPKVTNVPGILLRKSNTAILLYQHCCVAVCARILLYLDVSCVQTTNRSAY